MHIFIYSSFLFLYQLGIRLAAIVNPKARQWIAGRQSIFTHLQEEMGNAMPAVIWMHCSSLGEFEQGRPLLEGIRKNYPSHKILLTFFSPSGYEVSKDYPGADFIFYLPLDSRKNADRFLEIVKPQLVLWVKYDYWYYFLSALKQKNIPVLLISGVFLKEYNFFKWHGKLHRNMLQCFSHLFVQTEDSAQLLKSIGFNNNVTVPGDTRFDRVRQIAEKFEPVEEIEKFCGGSPVIVAGSTWEEDEEELDHFANTHPEIKFIIAPHEVTEARIKESEKLFKNSVRFSKMSREWGVGIQQEDPNVLIIDNIGMLSRLYKYGTIAYLGGGFGNDGVHNVLEAAVYGKPVIFGPVYEKYVEAVELVEKGAAYSFESAIELEQLINDILANPEWLKESGQAALDYVNAKVGATSAILTYIQENRLLTTR